MAPRILIAEDNDRFADLLQSLLRRSGLQAERARDGVEAASRIAAAPPDLLLLDLKLPRLSGIDLLKKLRAAPRTRNLPVVILTGVYRGEKFARAASALGVTEYLEKPCRGADLLATLQRALKPGDAGGPHVPQTIDRHLLKAFSTRFSGLYTLRGTGASHQLFFLQGLPASLRPGFTHADFGDFLHRRGIISREEYDFYRGEGKHRHEALVQMGCLEYPDLQREKLAYLEEELTGAFALPPMSAAEQAFQLPSHLQVVTVNVPQVLLRGYTRHDKTGETAGLLERYGSSYPLPAAGYYHFVNFLAPSLEGKLFLQRMDGSRTLAQCAEEGDKGIGALLKTLKGLGMITFARQPSSAPPPKGFPLRTLFNALEEESPVEPEILENFSDLVGNAVPDLGLPDEEPPAAAAKPSSRGEQVRRFRREIDGKNYYEIFGLSPGRFSFDKLKESYFRLTREFGPEMLMELSGEEASLAEEILATVTTAYNTLSDVVKKERYDELLGSDQIGLGREGDDTFQAQVQFQSAKVFLDMEEWDSAEKALQDACNIDPKNGEYLAHLAWAIYRNPKNAASRAALEKARQMLNRALTLQKSADGFAFKGWMLMEGGQDALAESEFTKALKLNARQMLARKGLRQIQEKREQEKKGLFRRMFR